MENSKEVELWTIESNREDLIYIIWSSWRRQQKERAISKELVADKFSDLVKGNKTSDLGIPMKSKRD